MVASIPLSFNTFVVKLAFNISLALALPLASISNLKASFSAFSILKSYSKASCSCFNFFQLHLEVFEVKLHLLLKQHLDL